MTQVHEQVCYCYGCMKNNEQHHYARVVKTLYAKDQAISAMQRAEKAAEKKRLQRQQQGEQLVQLAAKIRYLPIFCMQCGFVLDTAMDGTQRCTFCGAEGDQWRRELETIRDLEASRIFLLSVAAISTAICVLIVVVMVGITRHYGDGALGFGSFVVIFYPTVLWLLFDTKKMYNKTVQRFTESREKPFRELYEAALAEVSPLDTPRVQTRQESEDAIDHCLNDCRWCGTASTGPR